MVWIIIKYCGSKMGDAPFFFVSNEGLQSAWQTNLTLSLAYSVCPEMSFNFSDFPLHLS